MKAKTFQSSMQDQIKAETQSCYVLGTSNNCIEGMALFPYAGRCAPQISFLRAPWDLW